MAATLALLALVPLAQAKIVNTGFGRTFGFVGQHSPAGTHGGEFKEDSNSIAINQAGAGGVPPGTVYMVDQSQNRIQRFSASGVFERAWGKNVYGLDEVHEFILHNADSGTFTLTVGGETTAPIPSSPSEETVQAALEALPSIGAGNVRVARAPQYEGPFIHVGPYRIRYVEALSGIDIGPISANGSALVPPEPAETASISTSTAQDGLGGSFAGFEICTVALECQSGMSSAPSAENGGYLDSPYGIAINQTTGNVYVTDRGNSRISEFDADGNFIRAWGWNVVMAGKPNDLGAGYEICDTTAGNVPADCQSGTSTFSGSGVGQIGFGHTAPAIDASGDVWVAEGFPGYRMTEFSEDGDFLRIVGTGVVTDGAEGTGTLTSGSTSVTKVAMTKRYFEVGRAITGTGIEPGTTITAVNGPAGTLTLSQAASATGPQTLSVAPGAGNVSANEFQKLEFKAGTPSGKPTGGAFALKFEGESTGGEGQGHLTSASNVITNVTSPDMSKFKVGQVITGKEFGYVDDLPLETRITAVGANTITVSNPAPYNYDVEVASYDLPFDATPLEVESALNGLDKIGGTGGVVDVTGSSGGPYTFEFKGTRFAGADVPMLQVHGTQFPPATYGLVPASTEHSFMSETPAGLETCTSPAECRPGSTGAASNQFGEDSPQGISFDSSQNLYVLDIANKRVLKFNAAVDSVSPFSPASFLPYTSDAIRQQAAVAGGSRLVYAVRNTQSASEMQLIELDTSGAVVDTSLVGSKVPAGFAGENIAGLAENEDTNTLYAVAPWSDAPRTVLMLQSAPPISPTFSLDPVTTKTGTNAVFSGSVDPTGGLVTCAYEFSTDEENWTPVKEPKCVPLDPNSGSQAVSQDLSAQEPKIELVPNSHYYVRLVVSRALIPNSTEYSSVQEFDTDAVLPLVDRLNAVQIDDTSAKVSVRVNPRHSATSYVVKYGTTPAMGSTTSPVAVGDSATPLIVSQALESLAPNTKYFYEVVATSAPGSTGSGQKAFVTRAEPVPLLDDRAYEQVTPTEKNSANVDTTVNGGLSNRIAADGNAISFCSAISFGEEPPIMSFPCVGYRSLRTTDGWVTSGSIPRWCQIDDSIPTGPALASVGAYDKNLDHAAFEISEGGSCTLPPLDPAAPDTSKNLYRKDFTSDPFAYDLLTPAPGFEPMYALGHTQVAGGSEDFSHIIFSSTGKQTADAPVGDFPKLYDWNEGTLTLISRDTSGNPLTEESQVVGNAIPHHGISADGSRVLYRYPVGGSCPSFSGCRLFMSEDASDIQYVSESECTIGPCPSDSSIITTFRQATKDLSRVWFSSSAKLNDEDMSASEQDLYMYIRGPNPAGEPDNLTLLTKDSEPADGTEAKFREFLGSSEDGNTVYFVTQRQLVPGASIAKGHKIYRWQYNGGSPTLDYLFSLPLPLKEHETGFSEGERQKIVSDDGKYLRIQTYSQLDPAVDYDDTFDVYRWDAVTGAVCVSCQPPGQPSNGNSWSRMSPGVPGMQLSAMSADGEKIFFQTPDSLLPADENGNVLDVYEWNEGTLGLISNGHSGVQSYLLGVDESADNAFFVTNEKLVGWDVDTNNDIYTARVGGGLPDPDPGEPICEGEQCRTQGSQAPPPITAGTGVFDGPENKPALAPCGKGFKKMKVRGKVVCKSTKKNRKRHSRNRREQRADQTRRTGR